MQDAETLCLDRIGADCGNVCLKREMSCDMENFASWTISYPLKRRGKGIWKSLSSMNYLRIQMLTGQ